MVFTTTENYSDWSFFVFWTGRQLTMWITHSWWFLSHPGKFLTDAATPFLRTSYLCYDDKDVAMYKDSLVIYFTDSSGARTRVLSITRRHSNHYTTTPPLQSRDIFISVKSCGHWAKLNNFVIPFPAGSTPFRVRFVSDANEQSGGTSAIDQETMIAPGGHLGFQLAYKQMNCI